MELRQMPATLWHVASVLLASCFHVASTLAASCFHVASTLWRVCNPPPSVAGSATREVERGVVVRGTNPLPYADGLQTRLNVTGTWMTRLSSLFTLHFSLFTFHSSLFTLHFSLFTFHSHSSLFTLHFSLFTFHSSLFTFHSSLPSPPYTSASIPHSGRQSSRPGPRAPSL